MGKTIAEKILSSHCGKDLSAGDFVICKIDFAFGQDGTSSIIIDRIKDLGVKKLKVDFCMVIDHNAPSPTEGAARIQKRMRQFSSDYNSVLYDVGCGVCHQVIPESGRILPGDLVLGADSHTCTYGAIGVFSTGVGSTDLAMALATGKNWFKVPETIKIIVKGKIPRGIFAKDIILYIIANLTANGATYKAMEFSGAAIDSLDMDGRFTICNMAVEMGAKCAFMPQDKKTLSWLASHAGSSRKIKTISADSDACYAFTKEYDISKLKPQVAKPHQVDNAVSVDKIEGIKIDEAFLGTCTNGRFSDLKIAASMLKSNKVNKNTKFIIAPASRSIFLQALNSGLIDIFVKAQALVIAPGCGPCVGTHCGVPADGEVVISTANRNFKGRMGNPNAFIYLASPATVTASAITGKITDPRKYL